MSTIFSSTYQLCRIWHITTAAPSTTTSSLQDIYTAGQESPDARHRHPERLADCCSSADPHDGEGEEEEGDYAKDLGNLNFSVLFIVSA